jgi:phenylalanyl-tRNA synthetase beta chain
VAAYGLSGRVGFFAVSLERLLDESQVPRRPMQAEPVSRFPATDIDLAFVVPDDKPAGEVAATIRSAGGQLLEWVRLFDVYPRGDGRRSLAYRLRLRALDRTLTDAETAEIRQRVIAAVAAEHGGELRG